VLINKRLSDKISTVEFQVGPFEFPPRLNGEVYANFLNDELPDLLDLDDVPSILGTSLVSTRWCSSALYNSSSTSP
jgi:hypothetical protein